MKGNKLNKSYSTILTLVLASVFAFIYSRNNYWLYAGISIGVTSVLSSFIAIKIDQFWMSFSSVLSKIMPNILLTIVYFLCLVPIAFLSRIFVKKTPLFLKNNCDSLFVKSTEKFDSSFFEKPW